MGEKPPTTTNQSHNKNNATTMTATSTIKRFIYILDIFCALLGAVLIGFGVYTLLTFKTNELVTTAAYAYIGTGVSVFVVLLFLTIAAARENVCCTLTVIILMVAVIIAQIAVSFLLTKAERDVASIMANTLDASWEEELKKPGVMSHYESWFTCCGRASPQDYVVNGRMPPPTCFQNNESSVADNLIESGCRIKFEQYCSNLLRAFNIVNWILIVLELLVTLISCWLCNSVRNNRRRSYY